MSCGTLELWSNEQVDSPTCRDVKGLLSSAVWLAKD